MSLQHEYKKTPKISIVTPSFNQGEYLEQTILSVLNQNYPNLEYIIIDGGSTDNSVDIIKKYEDRITYWVSEKDKGQSHAINKGIKKCTGDLFAWINSDDYYEANAFRNVIDAYNENPDTDFICAYINLFEDKTNEVFLKHRMRVFNSPEKTIFKHSYNQQGSFWKTAIFNKIGTLNEHLDYVFDMEFWFRYIAEFGTKNVIKIDNTIANFRHHSTSKTVSDMPKFWNETDLLFQYISREFNISKRAELFFFPEKGHIKEYNFKWSFNYPRRELAEQGLLLYTFVKIKFRWKYINKKVYIKGFFKQNIFRTSLIFFKMIMNYFIRIK